MIHKYEGQEENAVCNREIQDEGKSIWCPGIMKLVQLENTMGNSEDFKLVCDECGGEFSK